MKTGIKFAALAALPIDQRENALKQAIDFELRKTCIMLSFLEAHKHLAARRFAANDPNLKNGTLPDVSEKQLAAFLDQNTHLLIDAESQKGLAASGQLHTAGKALWGEKYATGGDNPYLNDLASRLASFYHTNMPEVDTGWMQLFDLVDLRNQAQDHFDIIDTNAGITYEQIKQGGEIKKRTKISEAKSTCSVVTYGAALGLLDDWLRFQQFWAIDQVIDEFRSQHFDKMAEVHYALLTALGSGVDTAFDTDDAKTFNNAASTILTNVRDSGYGVGQNARFKVVCAPAHVGRVMRMLAAQQGSQLVAFGTLSQPIAFTVDAVIATPFVPSNSTGYYLVLPGRKMKRGVWQDLSIEQMRNAAIRANDWYASAQYNAILGDSNQVRRVKFS